MRTMADAVRRRTARAVDRWRGWPGRSGLPGRPGRSVWPVWPRRSAWPGGVRDAGMATAEYAIVTVAAVGFAGLLILVLRSDEVRGLLLGIVRGALSV